jgi:uncharacterized membrane protein YfcA
VCIAVARPDYALGARRTLIAVWAGAAVVLVGAVVLRLIGVAPLATHPIDYSPIVLVALGLLVSFVGEHARSILGMGYGTTVTGVLVALGLDPHMVVPAVLLLGILPASIDVGSYGWSDPSVPSPTRRLIGMGVIIAVAGMVGAVFGAWGALSLSGPALSGVIAAVLLAVGVLAAIEGRVSFRPLKGRVAAVVLGLVAGAGRGLMGGAYGPVLGSLDIDTEDSKTTTRAVLALPELLSCAAALAVFGIPASPPLWNLIGGLMVGSLVVKMLSALPVPPPAVEVARAVTAVGTIVLAGLLTLSTAAY